MTREQVEAVKKYMIRKHSRRNFTIDEVITAARAKGYTIDICNLRGWATMYGDIFGVTTACGLDEAWWK